MTYKESEYITEQYAEMPMQRLMDTIVDAEHLDAHRERCRIEVVKRSKLDIVKI
jgi:hypothetical protein